MPRGQEIPRGIVHVAHGDWPKQGIRIPIALSLYLYIHYHVLLFFSLTNIVYSLAYKERKRESSEIKTDMVLTSERVLYHDADIPFISFFHGGAH